MAYVARKTKAEKTQIERLNKARADKTELEVKIKAGAYVPLSEVRDIWFTLTNRFKKRLSLVADTVAGQVSLESDPGINKLTIREAIDQALMELSELEFSTQEIHMPYEEEFEPEKKPKKTKGSESNPFQDKKEK